MVEFFSRRRVSFFKFFSSILEVFDVFFISFYQVRDLSLWIRLFRNFSVVENFSLDILRWQKVSVVSVDPEPANFFSDWEARLVVGKVEDEEKEGVKIFRVSI